MYRYTFFTWLLANLLHPIGIIIYFEGLSVSLGEQLVLSYILILFYSLFISSASLLISFLIISIILLLKLPDWCKFLCWLIATPFIVIVNILTLELLTEGEIGMTGRDLEIGIPSMITIVAVVLARYDYFFDMCLAARVEKGSAEV
jgi:hypothetical protein